MRVCFALLFSAFLGFAAVASADGKKKKTSTATASASSSSEKSSESNSSGISISSEQSNGKGKVKLNGEEVWSGKVKKGLIAVSKSENGRDLAAAFDGRKLVWENVDGAGAQLEAERKKAADLIPKP